MSYKNDCFWEKVQTFLPLKNQISTDIFPQEYFIDIQNIKVHIDHYKVKNAKARIILLHGVGGNGRLLSFIAVPLVRNGIEVICPDLPLYGYTEYKGTITYETWVKCGIAIVQELSHDTLPAFLMGLSAGGMLAYQIATQCPSIKGILATCILDQRNKYIRRRTARNAFISHIGNIFLPSTYKIVGSLSIPMKMVSNMKKITNNNELTKLLMQDKKSSGARVPLAFIHSMLNPVILIEPECYTKCPFLLVHPGDDHWTDITLSRLFFDRLACHKEIHILEGAGHFPIEETGLQQLEDYCVEFITYQINNL